MARLYQPRAYAPAMLDHILSQPRSALWASMGLGKTVVTLTALDILSLVDPGPALVIAPKRVAMSTWPAEAAKWTHLAHLRVSVIVGTPKQRAAAIAAPADIYTTNYENIPWLVEQHATTWPYKKIVLDESTRVKGYRSKQGGQRARALARVTSRVDWLLELTGTPAPNGLHDLWGQVWFLDHGERLGRSFTAFTDRWFRTVQVGEDRFAIKRIPLDHAQAEIEARLRDVCLTVDARDHFDLRKPIVSDVVIDLPPAARRIYDDMEGALFTELQNGAEIEAFGAASKASKCLQIASGAVYDEDKNTEHVHDAKLDALRSVVEEAAGAPVIVAYHYQHDLKRLLEAFPQGRWLDAKPETERDFCEGKIPLLFAHPQSAGHGLNLQHGGNIIVFFSHWWNAESYEQMIERIGPVRQLQAGFDRPVYVYHIVARDTLDSTVLYALANKISVQDALLGAMKQRSK